MRILLALQELQEFIRNCFLDIDALCGEANLSVVKGYCKVLMSGRVLESNTYNP